MMIGVAGRARRFLPRGSTLPADAWHARHVGILALLWAHAAAVPAYALIQGFSLFHAVLEAAILPTAALLATWPRLTRRTRTAVASLGLLSASAVLIHLSGGVIEVHFHFFVMVTVVALYQDWIPFLSSVAYVLLHHGIMGALAPGSVFNHAAALNDPWRWAAIHSLFIAGISVVCLVTWRLNEAILDDRRIAEERLLEETRVVRTLHDVGLSLATELDTRSVMQTVTDAATALTDARFGVFIYDSTDDTGEVRRLYTVSGAPIEAFEEFKLRSTGSMFDPTLAEQTVRLDDAQGDPRLREPTSNTGAEGDLWARSYLAVPVRSRSGEIHGRLLFGHPQQDRFDAVHERLVTGIAAHAAVALDNARLYGEQRNTALTLQRSLLPQTVPQITGARIAFAYSPASSHAEIGGDWYDVLLLADGRVALTIGDVIGHDLRAAAVMGQLRNVMRIAALEAESPADALSKVDRYMAAAGLTDLTTVAQVHYDACDATLTFALAGHPPPLVIHADGHGTFLEADPMPPLGAGLIAGTDGRHDHVVGLSPGDAVVLYTDGLVERRGTSLEARFAELILVGAASVALPPDQLCAALLSQLAGDGDQTDDVALLVLALDAAEASREPPLRFETVCLDTTSEVDLRSVASRTPASVPG